MEPWGGWGGMCASLTGSQLRGRAFFGHGSGLWSMCLGGTTTQRRLQKVPGCKVQHTNTEVACCNLAWSSELHCGDPPPPWHINIDRGPRCCWLMGWCCPLLAEPGTNTQTQILTYDVTLECEDVSEVIFRIWNSWKYLNFNVVFRSAWILV